MTKSTLFSVDRMTLLVLARSECSILAWKLRANHGGTSFNVSFPAYTGAQYDASSTNLTYFVPTPDLENNTKGIDITLSFLSPITPTSTFRQAIPASYFTVTVSGDTPVDVYVDVNGQWVSGDRGSQLTWDFYQEKFQKGRGLKTMTFRRDTEQLLTEINDRSEWGSFYFTAPLVSTEA